MVESHFNNFSFSSTKIKKVVHATLKVIIGLFSKLRGNVAHFGQTHYKPLGVWFGLCDVWRLNRALHFYFNIRPQNVLHWPDLFMPFSGVHLPSDRRKTVFNYRKYLVHNNTDPLEATFFIAPVSVQNQLGISCIQHNIT